MTDSGTAFSKLILAKAKHLAEEARQGTSLLVAVLGPGLGDSNDSGSIKRQQIRVALELDGHRPFFPEDCVSSDPPFMSLLERERRLLDRPDVDLVIILYTPTSHGVATELGHFVAVPDIRAKTAVLIPIDLYTPDEGLVANTVREYRIRMPYSAEHLKSCKIVSECRRWANDRATGRWQGSEPHSF